MSLIKKFCTLAWARSCDLNVEISSKQSRKTTKNRLGAQKRFGRRKNYGLKIIRVSGPNNKRHNVCNKALKVPKGLEAEVDHGLKHTL